MSLIKSNLKKIEELKAPTARLDRTSIMVEVGEPISVACLTTGSPRPYIKWLINQQDISELNYDFRVNKNILHLVSAPRDLNGLKVTCEAWNGIGEKAQATAQLYVKHKKDSRNRLSVNLRVEEDTGLGQELKLKCDYTVRSSLFFKIKPIIQLS